jgi:hypothetical protein
VLIGVVPPLMLKTAANPGGLPIKALDEIRKNVLADRSQFKDLGAPFYGASVLIYCYLLKSRFDKSAPPSVRRARRSAQVLRRHTNVARRCGPATPLASSCTFALTIEILCELISWHISCL